MNKYKNKYKMTLAQLLLGIFLFENCTQLQLKPTPVNPESVRQKEISVKTNLKLESRNNEEERVIGHSKTGYIINDHDQLSSGIRRASTIDNVVDDNYLSYSGNAVDNTAADITETSTDSAPIAHSLIARADSSPVTIRVDEAYFESYQGRIIYGANDYDLSGRSVSGTGDINFDGIPDVIIGADNADPLGINNQNSGSSYVIYGKKGGYKSQIKLADLNSTFGFRLDGAVAGDLSGSNVRNAEDINNDGISDIIIGAYDAQTPNGQAGASYVLYGKPGGYSGPISLGGLGSNGFRIYGTASTSLGTCNGQPCDVGNRLGWSNQGVGDVNGDDIDDIIIGAYATPRNGQDFAGSVYVIYGKQGGYSGSLNMGNWGSFNPPIGFRIDGFEASSYVGYAVGSGGDLNGDGLKDIIFSAPGRSPFGRTDAGSVYVIYGKQGGYPTINLANLNSSLGFRIDGATANFLGTAPTNIAGAGDVNADGIDDVIIGAFLASPNNTTSAGSAYVLYGRQGGYPNLDLAKFNSTLGFRIDGESSSDSLGISVSPAGDVNADKIDDIIVGAPDANSAAGSAYVIYGKKGGYPSSLNVGTLSPYDGFRIRGRAGADFLGFSASTAGDFNDDGFDDVVCGAWQYSSPLYGTSVGASYVVYGFNQPPILVKNALTITGAQTLTVDRNNLYINDTDTSSERLTFEVVNLQNGIFSNGAQASITQFTQQDVDEGRIQFTSTSCEQAPTYAIQVSDVAHTTSASVADVTYTPTCFSASSASGTENLLWYSPVNWYKGIKNLFISSQEEVDLDSSHIADLTPDRSTYKSLQTTEIDNRDYLNYQRSFRRATREISNPIDLRRLKNEQGFRVDGAAAGDLSGSLISNVGDFNNDGIDDFVISDQTADANGDGRSSYVIYGKQGGYSSAIDLANLNPTVGFRLYSARVASVSGVGDINKDGIKDIIIGAPTDAPNGNIAAGSSYVVYGKQGGYSSAIDLANLGTGVGFRINGNSGGQSGYSVSGAGDVNDDGIDDLIVGAPFSDPSGKTNAGSAFIIYGRQGGYNTTIALTNLMPTVGFQINGALAQNRLGAVVSYAGDMNNDGISDLVMSAPSSPGSSYVVYGKKGGYNTLINLENFNATVGFQINGAFVTSMSEVGDFNGDSINDIILGADGASPNGKTNAGSSYVIYGKQGGYNVPIDLASLDSAVGFRINGAAASDHAGFSVSGVGDINNDGMKDIVVGAYGTFYPGKTDGGTSYEIYLGGSSYIIYGKQGGYNQTIELENFTTTDGFQVNGGFSGDLSGWSVSRAGDINQDGVDDLIIGARGAGFYYTEDERVSAGATFVIYGTDSSNTSMSTTSGSTGDGFVSAASSLQPSWYSPARWIKAISSYFQAKEPVIDTPESEQMLKLQAKCVRMIEEADSQTADKWYRYSLEDLEEEMSEMLKHPETITMGTVNRFRMLIADVNKNYLTEPLLTKPSFFGVFNNRVEINGLGINQEGNLLQPSVMPMLEAGYVAPAIGN